VTVLIGLFLLAVGESTDLKGFGAGLFSLVFSGGSFANGGNCWSVIFVETLGLVGNGESNFSTLELVCDSTDGGLRFVLMRVGRGGCIAGFLLWKRVAICAF